MTASTKSNLPSDLLTQLETLRPQMNHISSDIHWVQLDPHIRGILRNALQIAEHDEISEVLSLPERLIGIWHEQSRALEDLRAEMIRHQQEQPNTPLGHRDDLIEIITTFIHGTTAKNLAKALGDIVSSTTILRWLRKSHGVREIRILVDRNGHPIAKSSVNIENLTEDFVPSPASLQSKLVAIPQIESQASPSIPLEVEKPTNLQHKMQKPSLPPIMPLEETIQAIKLKSHLARHQDKKRRCYSQLERSHLAELVNIYGPKQVHEYFGVSFDTLARFKRHHDRDTAPSRGRLPSKYEIVVTLMTKHPGMGPMQIRDYLRRHKGLQYGVNSIRKVMEQHGWVAPYTKKSRLNDDLRRYEAVRKNYMWHLDFKHHYINNTKVAILLAQDDYSRFLVGHSFGQNENADIVIAMIQESIALYGRPDLIMTDGGSAFYSWQGISQLHRLLEDFGIDHYRAKTANVNGKIESVCCQIEKELLNTQSFSSLTHFGNELAQWVGHYNFMRVHQGLPGEAVPADRYFPGAYKWYNANADLTKKQALVAETMAGLLMALKKPVDPKE